jgi:hypothetical protein
VENPPELCAGGNFDQSYGVLNASGWSDTNCSIAAPFVCKLLNPRGIFKWVSRCPSAPCTCRRCAPV